MSTRPRSRLHEEEEEHVNHERWLVTYADMVTLLMVLFIVMFSISQVDQRKFQELRDGLAAGFGAQDSILEGANSLQPEMGARPVSPDLQPISADPAARARVQRAVEESRRLERDRRAADARRELARLEALRERLMTALEEAGLRGDVRASYDERGLVLSLVSRHVVFENDLAVLTARGISVVDQLGAVLAAVPDPVQVDGHTNQVPVKPRYYDTDWDLSAARALTVLGRLQGVAGLPPRRLSLAAYGHTRPMVDPSLPRSQRVNKRVDVVVLASTDHETSALIPGLARERRSGTSEAPGPSGPGAAATGDGATAAGAPQLSLPPSPLLPPGPDS
ncbi:MAG: flagellar motor protein MotB [Nocardioides sp.]|nr:flagellar motor protein MotB [Nocardioides sp.]